MKKIFLILIVSLIGTAPNAQIDHSVWDDLLSKHVTKTGKVDYKGFRTDKQKLVAYLDSLVLHVPDKNDSDNAKKAFWVNAYNAHAIKLVLDHYPIRSINDIKLDGATTWTTRYIEMDGRKLSLSDIENKKLRSVYKDPRIHFVLNNASYSCPILVNKALTEENIEEILEVQTEAFINDDARNIVSKKMVQISSLFEWYQSDFGDVRTFYNQYAKSKIPSKVPIGYMPYSWDLNE